MANASPLLRAVSEKDFMAEIVEAAKLNHWHIYHTHDSRRSPAGFPDLTLVRGPQLLFLECKTETGKATQEQELWVQWLKQVRFVEAEIVRPRHLDEILATLKRAAR